MSFSSGNCVARIGWRLVLRAGWRRRAPPFLPLDADRAVQAEPELPPPYPSPAAQGHELAGRRRQLTSAREPDGLVHRRGDRGVGSRATHDPGWPALVFGARHPDGPDAPGRVPPGAAPNRGPDRLRHPPAWA